MYIIFIFDKTDIFYICIDFIYNIHLKARNFTYEFTATRIHHSR